jgi:hypothetical protein
MAAHQETVAWLDLGGASAQIAHMLQPGSTTSEENAARAARPVGTLSLGGGLPPPRCLPRGRGRATRPRCHARRRELARTLSRSGAGAAQ